MIILDQNIRIDKGQDIFNIKSDGRSHCFKIFEEVAAVIWHTHNRYYAVSKRTNNISFFTEDIKELYFNDSESKIIQCSKKFLEYFNNGSYCIALEEPEIRYFEVVRDGLGINFNKDLDSQIKGEFTYCNFTEAREIIFTKSTQFIDKDLVDGYKYQILNKNKRPLIITYSIPHFGGHEFIIDGHHKFLAYKDLLINPCFLHITTGGKLYENFENPLIKEYQEIMNESEFKHYKKVNGF